jgi:RNA polymerase subunit RPABC4/transcription elongation factor Spt4
MDKPLLRPDDDPAFVPLAMAYLCGDCNNIGNKSSQCPHCQSKSLASIQSMLSVTGSLHIDRAYLCLECNHIGADSMQCTHCNSPSLLSIMQCIDGTRAGHNRFR